MANIMMTEQRAAELQRVAAERERRRKDIEFQVEQWDKKQTMVQSQLSGLMAERSNLNACLADWDRQKSTYGESEILSEVVVENVFEGVCADRVKAVFSDAMKEMDRTCSKVSGLSGNIDLQIERLSQCMTVINANLAALRSELGLI